MSPIASSILTILALSSTALAFPKARRHPWNGGGPDYATGYGTGSGQGFAHSTGRIPFPAYNYTVGSGAGSSVQATSVPTLTVTVLPVAASSSVAALSFSNTTSAVPSVTGSVQVGAFFGRPSHGSVSSSFVESTTATSTFAESTSAASTSAESTSAASVTVESSTSSTVSSASASSTSSSSSSKLGLSYNTASLLSAFDGTSASWAYNWAASADGTISSDLEYVPMLWGLKSVSGWSDAAASAISSGSTHLLSFNEPDLSSQSDMEPATAAENHIEYLNPFADQAEIGSPAITNGAGTDPLMGIDWLNAFFKACGGECQVDFVAFHWYDAASNIDGFKSHVQDVIDAASSNGVSKVWLTEFGTTSGSDSEIVDFITEATSFLDSTAEVERYAYFMVGEGSGQLLSSSGELNTLGEAYVS
ncbi:hypothetical protein DV737_g2749, partial [Chaetothyriales sp. CBS 132003]